jgi:hypothetical protein
MTTIVDTDKITFADGSVQRSANGSSLLIARQQSNGGGASANNANIRRPLNTVVENSIAGASVDIANGNITLPPGKYWARGFGVTYASNQSVTYLLVPSTNTILIHGTGSYSDATAATCSAVSLFEGTFTLTTTTVMYINTYTQTARVDGLGNAVASGTTSVYAEISIERIA